MYIKRWSTSFKRNANQNWDITYHPLEWHYQKKKNKCWWGCPNILLIGTLVHCWWECTHNGTATVKNSMVVPQKIKNNYHNLAIPLLSNMSNSIQSRVSKILAHTCSLQIYSIYPRGGSNPNIHWQLNEENVGYTYNGILFRLKRRKSCHMLQRG